MDTTVNEEIRRTDFSVQQRCFRQRNREVRSLWLMARDSVFSKGEIHSMIGLVSVFNLLLEFVWFEFLLYNFFVSIHEMQSGGVMSIYIKKFQ
uniref:Uncharacterized protein n=1 Tax=Kalanchoe fedtschenkoi TaxID=63787 RepID=A0A7N0ZTF8_KALFE